MIILFVCTGNTCRSPMAEVIFNKLSTVKDVKALSAGISIVENSNTSMNSAAIIRKKIGKDIRDRYAVQLTENIIQEADIILTMTAFIKEVITSKLPQQREKVFSLNEYVGISGDIMDPYGGNIDIYEKTYEELEGSVNLLLQKLKQ